MASAKRLAVPPALSLFLTLTVVKIALWTTPAAAPSSVNTGQHFFPPYADARDRFGFDSGSLSGYDVAQLRAGWYSNWGASLNPAHPDQLVYVQLIRFTAGADPRDSSQVTVEPNKATIAEIAATHSGSLWLMSNEPDSIYQGNPILPEVYAIVYHDFFEYIKSLDPSALIANGGIVQPTPCRLEYLDIVVDTYLATYGEPMPVDVWNIHAFVLREVYGQWGGSTPPGVDPGCGIDYAVDDADDVAILLDNIKAMRAWMKDRGYRDKPLIITEYGILWPTWFAPQYSPARVSHYMTETFDLFLFTKDAYLGYPADDYRLVQAWAWYSLSDDQQYNGYLFRSDSKTLSPMGEAYAAYTAAIGDPLYADVSAGLVAAGPALIPTVSKTDGAGPLTSTVLFTGSVGNLGKLPVSDVLARVEVFSGDASAAVFHQDAYITVPARFDGVVVVPVTATLAGLRRYALLLSLDPEGWLDESRRWNNVATTTLDIRPDLVSLGLTHQVSSLGRQSTTCVLTASILNQGVWPSQATSATVHLETLPEGMPVQSLALPVPPLPVGAQVNLTSRLAWAAPFSDLYRLVLQLDEDDDVPEMDEDNNGDDALVPIALGTIVAPNATTVLTSVSGAVELVFPPGAVSTPTEILYTPLWPREWQVGRLTTSNVAFSLTAMSNGRPAPLVFALPVSVTWRYKHADVTALDEEHMRLFALRQGTMWNDAACQPYQRDANQSWVMAAICRTGQFVFGNRYDLYFPAIWHEGLSRSTQKEPMPSFTGGAGSPLLLP
jgi:hypothetical protein